MVNVSGHSYKALNACDNVESPHFLFAITYYGIDKLCACNNLKLIYIRLYVMQHSLRSYNFVRKLIRDVVG